MRENVEKVIEFDSYYIGRRSGIKRNNPVRMVIEVDHQDHRIRMTPVDDDELPDMKEVINFLLNDKDVQKEVSWAVHGYDRNGYISISNSLPGCFPAAQFELWWQRGFHQYKHGELWNYGSQFVIGSNGRIAMGSSIFTENGIFAGDLPDLLQNIIVDIIDYENDINEHALVTRLLRDMDTTELKKNPDLDWVWKKKNWRYVRPVKHRELSDSICR